MNEKIRNRVLALRPIDDLLFASLCKYQDAIEEILQTIMDDKELKIKDMHLQEDLSNLYGRKIILDSLCKLRDGKLVNIEVQKRRDIDHIRRTRYHASLLDSNTLMPGDDFKNLPETYIIYIVDFDLFKDHHVIQHVDKKLREANKPYDDGQHIIYLYTKGTEGPKELIELMKCFMQSEVQNQDYPKLSKAVNTIKHDEGEVKHMCDSMEEYAAEYAAEQSEKAAKEATEKAKYEEAIRSIQSIMTVGKMSLNDAVALSGYTIDDYYSMKEYLENLPKE